MSGPKTQTIEVDEVTAAALQRRAAVRGISVADLLAELAAEDPAGSDSVAGQIAELDRRWSRARKPVGTVPHDDVVRWLDTWGSTGFRPWQGK